MSSFANLPQAIDEGKGYNPITKDDLAFAGESMSDESALKLVVQDTEFAERFVNSKNLTVEWDTADNLNRALVAAENWPGTEKPRSGLPMPVVMEAMRSLLPQAQMAFFSDPQPFILDPKGKTSAAAARAMEHLVGWAMEQCGFQEEFRKCLKSGLLYGTLIGKSGWQTKTHIEKKYVKTPDGSVGYEPTERKISYPTFEYVSLRNALVSPQCTNQDIRNSRTVVFQKYITAMDLDDMRAGGDYKNIPSREQFKESLTDGTEPTKDSLLAMKYLSWRNNQAELPTNLGSANPLNQDLEILEHWSSDRVITVLQRTIVIRNEAHNMGEHKFRSACFEDVLNSFYGFGVAKLLAGEQGLQQGVVNKWVDSLSLKLSPSFHRKKGMGATAQSIQVAPGKVINDDGDLAPLEVEDISASAMTALGASEQRAARRVGASFGPEMPSQAMRTAEGVQAFTAGVQVQLQYFIETVADLVFKPVVMDFIQLIKDNMDPDDIRAILSDKDAKALETLDVMDVYNGQYAPDVLSTVKLAGRRAMAQMIQPISQLLGQPAMLSSMSQQGKKFDFTAFFEDVFEIVGWPGGEYIQDMTPEDIQRMQQSNPAVVKAQADQQAQQQQQSHDMAVIDAKGDQQAGVAAIRSILKAHEPDAKPLATSGAK